MINDIERRLADLGRHIDFPATPPLVVMVRPQLAQRPRRPVLNRRAVFVAVLAAIAGLALGVPPVRTAIAHWLGLQGVVISPVTPLSPTPTPHGTAAPSGPGSNLGLGQLRTLEVARGAAGFPVLVPRVSGPPDAVYVRTDLGLVVTLVYAPRSGLPPSAGTGVGLLVTEFRGASDPMLIQKFVGPGTTITPVMVLGGPGFWLDGAPHQLAYRLPDGSSAPDTLRLAGPTLVFEHGDVTIRVEGSVSETQALAIAESLG